MKNMLFQFLNLNPSKFYLKTNILTIFFIYYLILLQNFRNLFSNGLHGGIKFEFCAFNQVTRTHLLKKLAILNSFKTVLIE